MPLTIHVLAPEHRETPFDEEILEDLYAVGHRHLGNEASYHEVANQLLAGEALLIADDGKPIARVATHELLLMFLYGPAGVLELEYYMHTLLEVLSSRWEELPWRDVSVGTVFYVHQQGSDGLSRGASEPSIARPAIPWERLDQVVANGETSLFFDESRP